MTKTPTPKAVAVEAGPGALVRGRILLDLPQHDLFCGSYVALPAPLAESLQAAGAFDPAAPWPAE